MICQILGFFFNLKGVRKKKEKKSVDQSVLKCKDQIFIGKK